MCDDKSNLNYCLGRTETENSKYFTNFHISEVAQKYKILLSHLFSQFSVFGRSCVILFFPHFPHLFGFFLQRGNFGILVNPKVAIPPLPRGAISRRDDSFPKGGRSHFYRTHRSVSKKQMATHMHIHMHICICRY